MKKQKNNGQSLIEFALILPVFMLIVLGILDLGRIIYAFSTLHHAAHEGARYGAVHHCDTADIDAVTQHYIVGLNNNVTVTQNKTLDPDFGTPERITVGVEYQFRTITPLVGIFLGDDQAITLSSQSNQMIELRTACN